MPRFQFSLRALLVATIWLSLGSAAIGQVWRTDLNPSPQMAVLIGLLLAGIGGAIGALTGTTPVRHSMYGALGGLCVQAALVAFIILMNRR